MNTDTMKYTKEDLIRLNQEIMLTIIQHTEGCSNPIPYDENGFQYPDDRYLEIVKTIYDNSEAVNYFSDYGPPSVYEDHYNPRLNDFLEAHPVATKLDFIRDEKEYLVNFLNEECQKVEYFSDPYRLGIAWKELSYSTRRKLEFLKQKEQELTQGNNNHKNIDNNPKIKPEKLDKVYAVLQSYFVEGDHEKLYKLLQSGNDLDNPILFKDAGNKLTDVLRQLFDAEYMADCNKKSLGEWINTNFTYLKQNAVAEFKRETVRQNLTKRNYICKYPILDITKL